MQKRLGSRPPLPPPPPGSSCGDQFSISSAVSSMVCSQLKISMCRSYLDSGLPRSFSMSWKVRCFFGPWCTPRATPPLVFLPGWSASASPPPPPPGGAGELVDFPPTGEADALDRLVEGTISSVGPGLVAAKAAASSRSRLNSLWESRSSAR